ncbi:hypothetical protein NFHSH190041_24010 [Shewanella sp. NFH-SH190041]|uniref:GGDEF domain-containing protein n=1 Tax=Shewanella sp. NFH-SH190041 TaxID=2950245 RepID=UPI0021C4B0DC|nr:GGDEF domain-containing protein [Shewanella sp. NFH-SH190041]BDM64949.1 hypothetical protein NFHSH190041_24010 [Shewanella sp. NFH-SH190041]
MAKVLSPQLITAGNGLENLGGSGGTSLTLPTVSAQEEKQALAAELAATREQVSALQQDVLLLTLLLIAVLTILALGRYLRLFHFRLRRDDSDNRCHQRRCDELTGLCSRGQFEQQLAELAVSRRQGQYVVALINLDDFKQINDTYGFDAGDDVLVEFSNRVDAALRSSDLLVRWSGEEFLLLLAIGEPDAAERVLERLKDLVALEPFARKGGCLPVTVSVGASPVLTGQQLSAEWEHWFNKIDTALVQAKRQGRNRVVFSGTQISLEAVR